MIVTEDGSNPREPKDRADRLGFTHMEAWKSTGVLWAINKVLFHPRGFALALGADDEGNLTSWTLIGDGSECWAFDSDDPEFARFEAFLDSFRPGGVNDRKRAAAATVAP